MIKDPKRYREQSEQKRVRALRRLTYAQSAKLLEAFISSQLLRELHFAEDDNPRALARRFHATR